VITIPDVTAEQVIEAIEAVSLLTAQGADCTLERVGHFMALDMSDQHQRALAESALEAASILGFVNSSQSHGQSIYAVVPPLPRYVAEGAVPVKQALFRAQLESLAAYQLFKQRRAAGVEGIQAAQQSCAVYHIDTPAQTVRRVLEDWGTYAKSLSYDQRGQIVASMDATVLQALTDAVCALEDQHEGARQWIHGTVGPDAFPFIQGEVLDNLVSATVVCAQGSGSDRVILLSTNSYETFLRRVASIAPPVDLTGAHGPAQIGGKLRTARRIAARHLGSVQFAGQARIATEHGGDPEEGNACWQVTPELARATLLVILGSIRSIHKYQGGTLQL
jgi:hypothetical protein